MSRTTPQWKNEIISGFIVFLIALPLSLGIAMASGVPPFAGIIAAIIGGILVSRISGSNVTINGPAAGLIVVVLHGIEVLGKGDAGAGYRAMLAAVVVSGAILFLAGRLKAGKLGDLFPASAVHGMLAAIGVIIMSKQIHTLLGVVPHAKEPLELLAEIPNSMVHANPEIAAIGLASLAILLVFPFIRSSWISRIPVPMVVVVVGIALGRYFDLDHVHTYLWNPGASYEVGPKLLVSLPGNLLEGFTFPNFSALQLSGFWGVVLSLTLIQGLETLLSASAVDRFDPLRRRSDLNKDLAAVGLGSAVSGALGGLPIIAEIVRSRANVSSGAKTPWSNFFHGIFMLLFVALAPGLIHQIPLACLAAVLIVTGYRLASPSQFKHTLEIGWDQLAIFSATLVTTLATDLLVGVLTGIVLKFLLHLLRGASPRSMLSASMTEEADGEAVRIRIRKMAVFTNYLAIKNKLEKIPTGREVILDLSEAKLVDHTVMEKLAHFVEEYGRKGGAARLTGLETLKSTATHPLASRRKGK
jgi:MFS superfamily sulfate permease-like transporter